MGVETAPLLDNSAIKGWLRNARLAGGLKQNELARQLDVTAGLISQWESERLIRSVPNARRILRIAEITGYPIPDAWTTFKQKKPTFRFLRNRNAVQRDAHSVADEITAIAELLASRVGDPANSERNADLFARRYGVFGPETTTLQACGDTVGMTRERVRQIADRLLSAVPHTVLRFPRMQALAEAIADIPICSVEKAEEALRERLGAELNLLDARRFAADILGFRLPFAALEIRSPMSSVNGLVFVAGELPTYIERAVTLSKRLIGHSGAAHITLAWALTQKEFDQRIEFDEFRRVVASLPSFQWLKGNSWFWFGPDGSHNSLVERTKLILAVAQRHVDVEEIFAGIVRYARDRDSAIAEDAGVLPPLDVFFELLKSSPAFTRKQSDDFALMEAADPRQLLSEQSLLVYDALVERRGVASRNELNVALVRSKAMNQITFSVALSIHPAVRAVDRGIYALRGWLIDPSRYAECRRTVSVPLDDDGKAHSNRTVVPSAVNINGVVSWKFQLTAGALRNRMTHIPSVVLQGLQPGQYKTAEGRSVHVVGAPRSYLRGVVSAAIEKGAKPADWITVILDQRARHCRVEITTLKETSGV